MKKGKFERPNLLVILDIENMIAKCLDLANTYITILGDEYTRKKLLKIYGVVSPLKYIQNQSEGISPADKIEQIINDPVDKIFKYMDINPEDIPSDDEGNTQVII